MAQDVFDFVVVGVPRTPQTKSPKSRRDWRRRVREAAKAEWPESLAPLVGELSARIVYFFPGQTDLDVDGIVKFILDSLEGLVYEDDRTVFEVLCRKSPLWSLTALKNPPPMLVLRQVETHHVLVRICRGPDHQELPL